MLAVLTHSSQKAIALARVPGLLELFGFSFYFGGFNVGPQYPYATYSAFVSGELCLLPGLVWLSSIGALYGPSRTAPPGSYMQGTLRCVTGCAYMLASLVLVPMFPTAALVDPEFMQVSPHHYGASP